MEDMSALRWVAVVLGVLMLLAGVVFSLQGAYGIGGGSAMDNNPIWIYIGSAIALVGLVLAIVGLRARATPKA